LANVHLGAEHRRALQLLVHAPQGLTEGTLMRRLGFTLNMLSSLISDGLVQAERTTRRIGGRNVRVDRVRITKVGLEAIEGALGDWE
jgi:hypothetical protein